MKLHVGSGTVYLRGWMNVDLEGSGTFLAHERPDLVQRYATTEDAYYGRHAHKTLDDLKVPQQQEYVCDAYGSFADLPCQAGAASEVLARQSFEHLSITEARVALGELARCIRAGGVLRLDVPDTLTTLEQYRQTGDAIYLRHLLGPRNSDYGYHMMSYTTAGLQALVEERGWFEFTVAEPNIHLYPAICLRFERTSR